MRDSLKEDEKLGSKLIEEYLKIGERNKKTLIPIYVKDWRNIARVYFKIEQLKITEQWDVKLKTDVL
jgi:hypothetical protein